MLDHNSCPRGQPLWIFSPNKEGGIVMDTPVEFDSKNRPTHDYLSKTSMNVVTGIPRSIPEYLEPKGE